MLNLSKSKTHIIVKSKRELDLAKQVDICDTILREDGNSITIWTRNLGKWDRKRYVFFGESAEKDDDITGIKAYQSFYKYCGEEKVEEMKNILSPIPIWESYEQMHYYNPHYAGQKIYQDIFVFDANSSFTYGAFQLPKGFEPLKEYMQILYDKKQSASNKILRSRYKNLQNFLVGYFARVEKFISTRSEIIRLSNDNIIKRISEIQDKKGKIYLSNTDSIVTDNIGAEIMQKYLGKNAGQFKLEQQATRLYYKSPNAYQIGDKVIYGGVGYFARKNTDFFKDEEARQMGKLINAVDYILEENEEYKKVCRIEKGTVKVIIVNSLGEILKVLNYSIGD